MSCCTPQIPALGSCETEQLQPARPAGDLAPQRKAALGLQLGFQQLQRSPQQPENQDNLGVLRLPPWRQHCLHGQLFLHHSGGAFHFVFFLLSRKQGFVLANKLQHVYRNKNQVGDKTEKRKAGGIFLCRSGKKVF